MIPTHLTSVATQIQSDAQSFATRLPLAQF